MDNKKKFSARERIFSFIFLGIVLSISSASTLYLYWLIEQLIAFKSTVLFQTLDIPTLTIMMTVYFIVNLVFSAFFLAIMTRFIIHPIYEICEASEKVIKGNYSVEIRKRRGFKFINRTVDNFNLMTKHLKSVEMLQNDFVANVSHEIKTPLSAIDGYAKLLKNSSNLSQEEAGYLDKIISHSNYLTVLVEDILAITKFENQQIADSKKWYRLDEQIRKAILFLEQKIQSKNITLNIDLDSIKINANPTMFYHVWYNLISNAIKFSQQNSEIDITSKISNDEIIVKIKDHGVGMDQNTVEHIYEKFYQGENAQDLGGNGLGLALVKKIIDIYDGKITVESEVGKGTSFTVYLKQDN